MKRVSTSLLCTLFCLGLVSCSGFQPLLSGISPDPSANNRLEVGLAIITFEVSSLPPGSTWTYTINLGRYKGPPEGGLVRRSARCGSLVSMKVEPGSAVEEVRINIRTNERALAQSACRAGGPCTLSAKIECGF